MKPINYAIILVFFLSSYSFNGFANQKIIYKEQKQSLPKGYQSFCFVHHENALKNRKIKLNQTLKNSLKEQNSQVYFPLRDGLRDKFEDKNYEETCNNQNDFYVLSIYKMKDTKRRVPARIVNQPQYVPGSRVVYHHRKKGRVVKRGHGFFVNNYVTIPGYIQKGTDFKSYVFLYDRNWNLLFAGKNESFITKFNDKALEKIGKRTLKYLKKAR